VKPLKVWNLIRANQTASFSGVKVGGSCWNAYCW